VSMISRVVGLTRKTIYKALACQQKVAAN
jgi:hypothetical protein